MEQIMDIDELFTNELDIDDIINILLLIKEKFENKYKQLMHIHQIHIC